MIRVAVVGRAQGQVQPHEGKGALTGTGMFRIVWPQPHGTGKRKSAARQGMPSGRRGADGGDDLLVAGRSVVLNAMVGAWWIFPADLLLAFSVDIWAGRPSLMYVSGLSEGSSKGALVRGSAAASAGGPQKGMAQARSGKANEAASQRHRHSKSR